MSAHRLSRPSRSGTPGRDGAWARRVAAAGVLALTLGACSVAPAASPATSHDGYCTTADHNAVTVIIDYGDLGPAPTIGCAVDLPEGATGLDALVALHVAVTEVTRTPQFVCRINNYPALDQVVAIPGKPAYTEDCVATPPQAAYWTYWSATEGGTWTYSLQGYALHEVTIGGFEGYSFAHNITPTNAAPTVPPRTP